MLALAVASCSKEGSDSENGGLFSSETGYIKLAINLPATNNAGTKAPNDEFKDGTPNEYAVTDATLVLFEGNSEATATLSSAYDLNLSFNTQVPEDDNITTSTAQIVQKISDPLASGNNFYALVILNRNGLIEVTDNKLYFKGASTIDCTGKKLSEFIAATKITLSPTATIVKNTGADAEQFFMSNAPLFTAQGGGSDPVAGSVRILSEIDYNKIYETESLAAANPATEVYVERAASKVTFGLSSTIVKKTEINNLAFDVLGWQLDNTNKETYLVRDVASFGDWKSLYSNATPAPTDKYRFVGHTGVADGLYRTYWCTDPNYAPVKDGDGVIYWDENNVPADGWLEVSGAVAYCAENTFDVAHQKDINTTTVIVKVKFNDGDTFYTVNNNSGTLYTKDNLIAAIKAYFLTNDAITAVLKPLILGTVTADDLTVALSSVDTKAGIVTVTSIKVDKSVVSSGADLEAKNLELAGGTSALDLVNANNTIRRYVGGISYYPVHIKHFGDDLTPWRKGETETPSAGNIYPGESAANYLGRYGMVRNNWYDIEVTKIRNLGTATVPTLGNKIDPDVNPEDDPEGPGNGNYDDDIDEYISVKINILAWAKRTQKVEL